VKRLQSWQPDTHPGYTLVCEWDDEDPEAAHVCVEASENGVVLKDPQGIYDAVLNENRAKNLAIVALAKSLPEQYTKPLLDSDGDEVSDDKGPVRVIKDKYEVGFEPTPLGQPTILTIKGLDPALAAEMDTITPAEVSVRGA